MQDRLGEGEGRSSEGIVVRGEYCLVLYPESGRSIQQNMFE